MRRMLIVLAVLAFAACDATGPETWTEDLRLAIVSGDGQVGSVQEASAFSADILMAPVDGRYLSDTLVARLTDGAGNSANVPPNTVANYSVPDGCGAPWVNSASPDDSAYIKNLWERPAGALPDLQWHGDTLWASVCNMTTRAIVDGAFVEDTIYTAYFLPGPMATFHFQHSDSGVPTRVQPGDTIDARLWVRFANDQYGNEVPLDSVYATPDSHVIVHWVDRAVDMNADVATDTGWVVIVPAAELFTMPRDSTRFPGAYMTIVGADETSGNIAGMEIRH